MGMAWEGIENQRQFGKIKALHPINIFAMFDAQNHQDVDFALTIDVKDGTVIADAETEPADIGIGKAFGKREWIFLLAVMEYFTNDSLSGFVFQHLEIFPGGLGINDVMHTLA